MVLTIKLSLWSFVRLDGFLLVFGVLMVVFCGVARKVRRYTRRDRRVDFERSKRGWRYHPAGALGKNTRQFFSFRMTDEQRYPPNRTLLNQYKYTTDAEKSSGKIPKKDTLTFVPPALASKDLSFEPFHEKKQIQSFQTDTQ